MHKLKKVYIEITNQCNLNCSFCVASSRKEAFVSPGMFETILKSIKPNTDYIYMHVLGEPLLHPDLGVLLDICEHTGIKASITTNATLIGKRMESLINKPALRQINYSLHSIMENGKNYKHIINDIFALIEKTGNDVYHCLRLWNFGSDDEFYNADIINEIRFHIPDALYPNIITKGNGVKISSNVFLQQQQRFIWPDINGEKISSSGRCGAIKHDVGILADGTVVPCCLDAQGAIPLGNIYEKSLEEILEGTCAVNMREGFSKGQLREKLCQTCGFAKLLYQRS